MPRKGPKTELMQTEGYPLYSDVGHRMLDRLSSVKPQRIGKRLDDSNNFKCLFDIADQLSRRASNLLESEIGFTEDDTARIKKARNDGANVFMSGIGDLHFPFHFTPIVLKDILDNTKDRLELTDAEINTFTMRDFASIIREQWFQDILTNMAKTANGVWGNIGSVDNDYDGNNPLKTTTIGPLAERSYEVELTFSEEESLEIAKVSLSKLLKRSLARKLHGEDTVGCPVAARHRIVDPNDPHVQHLVESGYMKLRQRGDGTFVGTQEKTSIERSMFVLADFLDKYADTFGEPQGIPGAQ